jgi:hypothetical protein
MMRIISKNSSNYSVAFLLMFIVALGFLSSFSYIHSAMAAPGWLAGWEFRKSHVITSAVGAGTGYQVKMTVYYGSGSDSGQIVYCDGKCKADFGDLRFTGSDGVTLLDYWIEEQVDSDHATLWVEVAEDLSSDVTIYMYYGNVSATTMSNGDNTFIFFDNFVGDSLDLSKWVVRQGDVSVASGELVLTGITSPRGLIDSSTTFGINAAVHTKARLSQARTHTHHFCSMRESGTWYNRAADFYSVNTADNYAHYATVEANVTTIVPITLSDVASYHLYTATWKAGESRGYQDDTLKATITSNVPSANMGVVFFEGETVGTYCYVDWCFVSKCVDPEPAHGVWGSQEQSRKPVLSMNPTAAICRKLGETFTVKVNLSEPYYAEDFEFEISFNTTLLDYVSITYDAWHTGTTSADEINGILTGSTSGSPVTGNLTIVSITFVAACNHIWRNEATMPWHNVQSGSIFIQLATLSYPSSQDLQYQRGSLNQIEVGPDVIYSWSPIKGDVSLDGHVDIFDLSTIAQYISVKEGDPLWPAASKYDLTNSIGKSIDVLDLIIISTNYGYDYHP